MAKRRSFAALWIALLFILLGAPFLRKAGLHYDASLELACFYPCAAPVFKAKFLGYELPVMVLSYLGTLKTWLFLPILHFLDVTVTAVRLPFLIIGATSVWLFYSILDRISGRRAAIAGALLLATDVSFLVATCYDFGPIALLHCCMLAGVLLLLRFEKTGSSKLLAAAFFLFGLALWHKALFIWMLGGLGAATISIFPRRILALWSAKRLTIATLAICAGALPLIYYNFASHGATLHPSEVMSSNASFAQKVLILRRTMDGSVLFGWLTEEANPETAIAPQGLLQETSVKLSHGFGSRIANWMVYAFVVSLLLTTWLWFTPSRRAAFFAVIYLAVAWGLMLVLPNTGASLHHAILLWPFPHFLIAIAGAQISYSLGKRGWVVALAVLVALVGCNLLVVNHVYANLVTRGTTVIWTDAVVPLSRYLDTLVVKGKKIIAVDWGYSTTVCLLSDGNMPQQDISATLLDPRDANRNWIQFLMSEPDNVFVGYDKEHEIMPGVRERLAAIARQGGYRETVLSQIRDRNNRLRFEVFRYIPPGQ